MRTLLAAGMIVLLPLRAFAQTCPSSDINDVMNDPRVREALDEAWRDSMEGTPDEHEEGAWIQQCQMANGLNGEVRYYTQVLRWPHGELDLSWSWHRPPNDASCRTVGTFHTHPGPPMDHPESDGYNNDLPSNDDMAGSANEGLPGIIRFGSGDDVHDFAYGYNRMTEPRDPGWSCPVKAPPAHGFGDPHLLTLDGRVYDFMGIGDFVLARMQLGDVEVQGRLQPYGQHPGAAVTTGLAFRDGRDRVEWDLSDATTVRVNGVRHPLETGRVLKLRSRAQIRREDLSWVLISSTGDRLEFDFMGECLDYTFAAAAHRRGRVAGLFGDYDGDPGNDLRARDGGVVLLAASDLHDYRHPLYATFGESWRVSAAQTLFGTAYAPPAGVVVRTFPTPRAAPSAEVLTAAVTECRAAGVTDPALLDACVFDRVQAGSTAFVAGAARADDRIRTAVPIATPGAIAVDQELSGRLAEGTRSVAYAVTLPAGTYLIDGRGSRGTSWQLVNSKGEDLLIAASEMHDAPPRIAVPAGRYSLVVSLVPESTEGRFRARVRPSPTPAAIALPLGTAVNGRIDDAGQVVAYRLTLDAGTYDFQPTPTGELWWSLTDAAGNEVFDANQRVFMERAEALTIPKTGAYTLVVAGRYWVGTGTYQLEVARGR